MPNSKFEFFKVNNGVYWLNIPHAGLKILCGCPADTVKHLKKRGLIDKTEHNGVEFETGPNAILLSDVLIQNGLVSNLAEFPLLQMFYFQGLLIPNHPNNKGQKPLLIGSEQQIKAQMEYFYRGNYGLISQEELNATGVPPELAEEIWHIKLKFAFGRLRPTDELLDSLVVRDYKTEIKDNVFIERKSLNVFEISCEEESITIDLNLKLKEYYESPYYLGYHKVNREYFSIIHTGEGDAWDINRPCMASILMFQGKIFLIDAGPDLLNTMNSLGITINEVAGIFHTHAHDDHFASLNAFVRSDHRIKYFASAPVRASVSKKLCALMSLKEEDFYQFFDVQELNLDQWNNIDGLEVMPLLSPHPVETNIYYFRAYSDDRYFTYAHLADVASFRVMVNSIFKRNEGEKDYNYVLERVKKDYILKADIKKVDVGGGLIHGEAEDFSSDESTRILLAHISRSLTAKEKQIGSFAPFGSVDTLIETHQDFTRIFAYEFLKFYFPDVPQYERNILLNSPIVSMNAGDTLFRKGFIPQYVYLLLTGAVELVFPDAGIENLLSAGSLLAFYIDDGDKKAKATCRATCYISALQIPLESYLRFLHHNQIYDVLSKLEEHIFYLSNNWLFSENISLPVYIKIAQNLVPISFKTDEKLQLGKNSGLYLIREGRATLTSKANNVNVYLRKGDFFGTEPLFSKQEAKTEVVFFENAELWHLPIDLLKNIPIVYWKLLQTAHKRYII